MSHLTTVSWWTWWHAFILPLEPKLRQPIARLPMLNWRRVSTNGSPRLRVVHVVWQIYRRWTKTCRSRIKTGSNWWLSSVRCHTSICQCFTEHLLVTEHLFGLFSTVAFNRWQHSHCWRWLSSPRFWRREFRIIFTWRSPDLLFHAKMCNSEGVVRIRLRT